MNWIIVDTINALIDKLIEKILSLFGFKKEQEPQIQQTINNQKKKSIIDIQIGGRRVYHLYEKYNPAEELVPSEIKNSVTSTASDTLGYQDQEIEEVVNQYIQSQLNNENNEQDNNIKDN